MEKVFYTDAQLLEGLSLGDREAVSQIYERNYSMFTRWIEKYGAKTQDIEDVFQEALLILYQKSKSPEFCLTCMLSTYLLSVGKRIWMKKTANDNQVVYVTSDETFESYENDTDLVADLEIYWDQEEKFTNLEEALNALGNPCKKLLEEFYVNKKNMQDIANEFGYTNAQNAKTQKYKCLNRLRKIYFDLKSG